MSDATDRYIIRVGGGARSRVVQERGERLAANFESAACALAALVGTRGLFIGAGALLISPELFLACHSL